VLAGTNLDEQGLWAPTDPKLTELDEAALLRRLRRVLPGRDDDGRAHAERVVAVYREGNASATPRDLWLAIETDRNFRAPVAQLAAAQARHQPDTWVYLFTWKSPALGGALGACHALEIPLVFGTADRGALRTFVGDGPALERLTETMQDAWLAFARGVEPSAEWPRYEAARRATQLLGAECAVAEAPFERERRFWDSLASS
jgi:para-nitrobenzyl esterase